MCIVDIIIEETSLLLRCESGTDVCLKTASGWRKNGVLGADGVMS